MENCAGCGTSAESHPIAGIGWVLDLFQIKSDGPWRMYPVCKLCWEDPDHRRYRLKMHFFAREHGEIALSLAGSSNIGARQ